MKKINLFFTFFSLSVVCSLSVSSQNVVPGSQDLLDKLRLNKSISQVEGESYSSISGDPYLFKDFKPGKMIMKSGETYQLGIRFDMFASQMHMNEKGNIFTIIYPEKIKLIEVDGLKFVYSNYLKSAGDKDKQDASYFILEVDGKCKLLVKKNIRIQEPEPPKLYQDAKPAKFILNNDFYYLKLNDENAVKIKTEKELLKVLSNKKSELNNYIHSNKLGTKKMDDLKRIVIYYNSL